MTSNVNFLPLNTEVSKLRSVGLVIAGAETIRAPRADPDPPLERARRVFEAVLEEKSPMLNPRVLGAALRDAVVVAEEVVGAKVEKVVVVVAAAIMVVKCGGRRETAEQREVEICVRQGVVMCCSHGLNFSRVQWSGNRVQ
ncbi:hypothetical protein HanIR_Chr01g0041211 [Helianthus annuus]|nr:hypothetical protein HanIR_Chr01g0041211 [Helianthus annuus]